MILNFEKTVKIGEKEFLLYENCILIGNLNALYIGKLVRNEHRGISTHGWNTGIDSLVDRYVLSSKRKTKNGFEYGWEYPRPIHSAIHDMFVAQDIDGGGEVVILPYNPDNHDTDIIPIKKYCGML